MHDQQSIYTNSDWAEFFMLAATGQTEEAKKWLSDYSSAHPELDNADDEEQDCAIREAVRFLTKFAENWKDSILKQEVRQQRQNQRQKAIKSTEIEWNPNDPQFW
tara:strand:+ start:1422 stop:1736 length:315 start_codon:yes stop_codon:yes gene_type:complete